MNFLSASLRLCGLTAILAIAAFAQIPAPKDTLGFTPGDDRKLASWAQVVDYFKKLDAASDRMIFEEIGKTTMGAPFVYATVSSPDNLKNLTKYRDINDKLADPRKIGAGTLLSPSGERRLQRAAQKLIAEGKTIVLITFGIHSTEVGSTLSSMLIAHRLASSNEPEIKNILENTIILLVPSLNPDGVDIVKNWYDKTLGTPYEGTSPPELYHKYVGHDNNRDWYAFTQVETQLTVDKIHNVWHPQIVHDGHQQGANGSRLFLPPYMQPVEPNVPKQIVEGYTELGNYMAKSLRDKGYQGITTNSTYDAWTPARAYSHYHGGVRILSETASARLATPITVKYEDLRGGEGYDARVESSNFGPVWKGGEWKLRNITDYMTTAAFALMNHAADNRERWLARFYEIGKEAVRPRRRGEVHGFVFHSPYISSILEDAGLEVDPINRITINGKTTEKFQYVVRMDQPYGSFAKALLESQRYPDLKDTSGNPIAPYDVTAHSASLLYATKYYPQGYTILEPFRARFQRRPEPKGPEGSGNSGPNDHGCSERKDPIWVYRSFVPSMDEGWTRWVVEKFGSSIIETRDPYTCSQLVPKELSNRLIRESKMVADLDAVVSIPPNAPGATTIPGYRNKTIIFPDQSPNAILNGHRKGSMPDEYVGGVGKEGVENLKKFVEAGGTLVFLNRSSQFAIEQFNLPVKDVTRGLARKDFYIPGSILRTELDLSHPIAKGMPQQSIAWFENSPAFELVQSASFSSSVRDESRTLNARVIARYPSDPKQILLSGWALGAEKIAGKAALVEVTFGKGKIVLFGFRPQYRGQSLATFPLLFNAISR
ncbi:MAG: M14 family zinc carboxypeptidase [Pyrinomonadaceae bacterium]